MICKSPHVEDVIKFLEKFTDLYGFRRKCNQTEVIHSILKTKNIIAKVRTSKWKIVHRHYIPAQGRLIAQYNIQRM